MMNIRSTRLQAKQVFLSCVVPVYNEAEGIADFLGELERTVQGLSSHYEIIVINDGSSDDTEATLDAVSSAAVKVLHLSRNFGKETALTAGIEHASGEAVLLIDGDFQHPLTCIATFLERWAEGYDMVYGVRAHRLDESPLKRLGTKCFYSLLKRLSRIDIPPDAGDFRLMDRVVVNALCQLEERNRFMKGLYAWVGFKSLAVPFDVLERKTGTSKWHIGRLTNLALTAITSFSDIPLRAWSLIGLFVSAVAFLFGFYLIAKTLLFGVDVPGYATIVVAIMFFGGIQLLSIGIIGEYLANIFEEVKRRPKYLIAKKRGFEDGQQAVETPHSEPQAEQPHS